jgi:hypothetical protein
MSFASGFSEAESEPRGAWGDGDSGPRSP